ncbi:MAG TPA: adenylyl-sulfate kinase [Desulfonatronum sp.]|nr:adenylyl-sulfate kinase [Desulfonatronum sp.]
MKHAGRRGWALWFVGLPGSGKSSVAKAVLEELRARGHRVEHLEMDARRKVYFPSPTYSSEERAKAYDLFVEEAASLTQQGLGVIMDGTAFRLAMRHAARQRMAKFAEVYIRCPLNMAMTRERSRPGGLVMAGLYEKALDRKRTGRQYPGLGQVIGVDVPFEEDPGAECVVDSERMNVIEARDKVLAFWDAWSRST